MYVTTPVHNGTPLVTHATTPVHNSTPLVTYVTTPVHKGTKACFQRKTANKRPFLSKSQI